MKENKYETHYVFRRTGQDLAKVLEQYINDYKVFDYRNGIFYRRKFRQIH